MDSGFRRNDEKTAPPLVGTGRDLSLRTLLPGWFHSPNHEIKVFQQSHLVLGDDGVFQNPHVLDLAFHHVTRLEQIGFRVFLLQGHAAERAR